MSIACSPTAHLIDTSSPALARCSSPILQATHLLTEANTFHSTLPCLLSVSSASASPRHLRAALHLRYNEFPLFIARFHYLSPACVRNSTNQPVSCRYFRHHQLQLAAAAHAATAGAQLPTQTI
jgi:hypothetical protein